MSGAPPDIICVAQITFKFVNDAYFHFVTRVSIEFFYIYIRSHLTHSSQVKSTFIETYTEIIIIIDSIMTLSERRNVVAFFLNL